MDDLHVRVPLQRDELTRLRAKALRRGIWFKALTRIERALIDLTIRVVERVQSVLLAKLLASVVRKLLAAMEGEVTRLTRTMGRSLAQKLGEIARNWGNESASRWSNDEGFVRYLTITYLNTPAMFRS